MVTRSHKVLLLQSYDKQREENSNKISIKPDILTIPNGFYFEHSHLCNYPIYAQFTHKIVAMVTAVVFYCLSHRIASAEFNTKHKPYDN